VLGVADARLLEATVDAVATGDAKRALQALEECAEQGRDAGSFASDLEVRVRELLVVQVLGELPDELSLTPEADAALLAQAERVDHATVVRLLELLGEAMEAVRAGADARTRLELALVKAAKPEADVSMRALLARIERLERERGVVSAVAAQREVTVGERDGPVGQAGEPASQPRALAPGAGPALAAEVAPLVDDPPTAPNDEAPPASATPPAAPEPPSGVRDLESVCALWPAVVDLVRSENARLGAAIEMSRPVEVEGKELTLAFSSSFLKKQAGKPADRVTIVEALRAVTGGRWQLAYELREEQAPADGPAPPQRSEEEWVARFMSEFDAQEIAGEESPENERGEQAVTSNERGA